MGVGQLHFVSTWAMWWSRDDPQSQLRSPCALSDICGRITNAETSFTLSLLRSNWGQLHLVEHARNHPVRTVTKGARSSGPRNKKRAKPKEISVVMLEQNRKLHHKLQPRPLKRRSHRITSGSQRIASLFFYRWCFQKIRKIHPQFG